VKDEQVRNAYTFGFGFWALEFDLNSYQSMSIGPRSGQKKKGGGAPGKTRKSVTSWNGKGPSTDPER